jgi:hypothetical protein
LPSWAGVSIHVLRIAVFAGNGDRARPVACKGRRRRFHPLCCSCVVGAGPIAKAYTYTKPFADAGRFADAGSDSNRHQFRFVGRCGRNESRQQLSGAAGKPDNERVRERVAKQPRRWRRFGGDGRTALSDLGEAYGISVRNGAQANFVGDQRQTWGGVAGIGARIAPGVNIGFSVDQSRTTIDVPLALQSATLDLTQFGFNASVDRGPWTWAVALVHGFGKVNSSRDTGFGIASAGYNAQIDGALTELSYYWSADQSRIVPKASLEYTHASTGAFQEVGGLDPETATGATLERSRILLGAEIGHYWIVDQKILDLSAYGKFVDNVSQNLSSIIVSLGPESIAVQAIAESQYGADTGASASLSLSNTARLYINYDGKFRAAMQSHQGTVGVELKW